MEHLHLSTITAVSQISEPINLQEIYDKLPISEYIPFIEFGSDNPPRGFSKKMLKKTRSKKPKKKRIFYNQATIHVFNGHKIVNVKLFNNGKIQMTGLKKPNQGVLLINELMKHLQSFNLLPEKIINILSYKLVCINSDFCIGFEIDREGLQNEIINSGMYSSFEPCIYPGVNIKYFINTNNTNGICCCNSMCNGKGDGLSDGNCKKITIAVFKSGNIIITGGQNTDQLETAYYFITRFINRQKDKFMLHK